MNEPLRRTVKLINPHGLHLRPIRQFVELATRYQADVLVSDGKQRVNGKSAILLLGLGAPCGAELTIELSGADAEQAVDVLAEALLQVFPEDDEAEQKSA
jgi:phosphocarrier protein